jgi:hypothetical protein
MYKSKLIELYSSFSKDDLFQLKKWLILNSKQQHPDAIKLLDILLKKQKITKSIVHQERLFKQLYPNQKMNIARLRHVLSFAVQSLELFIKQKELFSDQQLTKKTLAKSYRAYGLKKYAQQNLDQSKTILQDQEKRNAKYYLNVYELELEQFELKLTNTRSSSTNLQEIIDSFSTFFVINLLRYACISISHQNLYKTSYDLPLLNSTLENICAGHYDDVPAIQLYYYSYLVQTQEESLDSFEKLKFYILTYKTVLSSQEYRELYTFVINYCIKQQNNGNDRFVQEAFDWYKLGIEESILLDNKGLLSRFTYLNTITLGLKLKQFDWVETFILNGAQLLELEHQASYQHYNMGKFFFATKAYKKAMPLFLSMNYDDLFMNIDIKVMQLKIYYEEQSWEALEHLLSSFNQFLQRKSIMSYHKENYLNLIKFTRALTDSYEVYALTAAIHSTNPLTERNWLLAQIKK